MGTETFAFIVALFGLAILILCAIVPIWIFFLAVRWALRQINMTYHSIVNIKK